MFGEYEYKEINQSTAQFIAHTRFNRLKRAHIINLVTGETKLINRDKVENFLNRSDVIFKTDDFGLNNIFMLDIECGNSFIRCIFKRAKIA